MDTLKERQLTLRASRRPIEYNYTNADIHNINSDPSEGYQFEYPVNWAGDPSTQKVIGIRRISYKPTSVNIALNVITNVPNKGEYSLPIVYVFTDQNTFEECIAEIVKGLNDELLKQLPQEEYIRFSAAYDKDKGTFKLTCGGDHHVSFKLDFIYGDDEQYDPNSGYFNHGVHIYYKSEFLKLFNQSITEANVDKVHNYTQHFMTELVFDNVWNRDSFYCHASFSDSPKHIIGINKDFFPIPSVLYDYRDNSCDFNVYFTTNTVHHILPRNGVMLIQLSYIFNYQNSYFNHL